MRPRAFERHTSTSLAIASPCPHRVSPALIPPSTRPQIVQFILERTGEAGGVPASPSPPPPPFTPTPFTPLLPQIVQFILERTGEAGRAPDVSDMDVTGGGVDPFTGGGGGGRSAAPHYVRPPPAPPVEFSVTGGGVDPFTGGSRAAAGEGGRRVRGGADGSAARTCSLG